MIERARQVYIVVCLIILSLVLLRVYLTSHYTEQGIEYGKVTEELQGIKEDNAILKQEILQNESYTSINEKARDNGFADSEYYYVK